MKAYKITLFVIDHDNSGPEGITSALQTARYPNRCISPAVKSIEERDIGEWRDDHPLNLRSTCEAEYTRLFGKPD